MINERQEIIDEMMLREQIRRVIRVVQENKKKEQEEAINEEKELRSIVRKIILSESAIDPVETAPRSGSTVENFLEELLQNTITQVIDDYEKLGEKQEREGFFAGFLAALRNKFNEFDAVDDAAGEKAALEEQEDEAEAEINIDIGDDEAPDTDLLIPTGEPTDLAPEEEDEEAEDLLEPPAESTAEYKLGYNAAQETIPKIATQVLSGYEQFAKVGDAERAALYRDWAIINYGLHMINKEKLITGEFPEMPADFAAEIEKFKTQGVENLPEL